MLTTTRLPITPWGHSVRGLLLVLLGLTTALSGRSAADDATWPRFRGENGEGRSALRGVPTMWTERDYEWTRQLPGKGHSSPVVWKERLFVTCGHEDGKRTLLCLSALTGEELWSQTMTLGANHLHLKNSYASGTPAVDGERVYAAFADDLHYVVNAFTLEGEPVWSKDLGSYDSQHGQGVSPIVHEDLVIVPNDQNAPSAIVALNRRTGEVVWSTTDRPYREASYSTPMVLTRPGRAPELVCLSGAAGLTGIDLETGRLLWSSGEMPLRTVASPVYGQGVVIGLCGQGGNGKYLAAVEPGAAEGGAAHIRYERDRELPYVPTPIVDGEHLFLWMDNGVVACVRMATGETLNTVRVGGKYSGSPVLIDGKLYCISESGEILVVTATPELTVLGRNPLGDESYSTPAVANGRVYFRGFHTLVCLKARGE